MSQKSNLCQILWFIKEERGDHFGLYKSYRLFTPWIFSVKLKMIMPISPTMSQDKIINPRWYESEDHDTFKYDIDKRQLMKSNGGDNVDEYSFECNKLCPKLLQER